MSIDGTWKLEVTTPMGKQTPTLVLSTSGGTASGTLTDQSGTPQPLKEPSATADTATWKVDVTTPFPMTVTFNVKLEGDKLVGAANAPMGAAPLTGVRA